MKARVDRLVSLIESMVEDRISILTAERERSRRNWTEDALFEAQATGVPLELPEEFVEEDRDIVGQIEHFMNILVEARKIQSEDEGAPAVKDAEPRKV